MAVIPKADEPVQRARHSRDLELGLCLSGGGYRAMLFHAGALARLNELGWLQRLDAISSVSGGSIAAGLLGAVWSRITFDQSGVGTNFALMYLCPLLEFAKTTADFSSIFLGVAAPWTTASQQVAKRYQALLGVGANLRALPDRPRFIFCSSNLTTGSLFRFSKRYIADYRLGQHFDPDLDLAIAVAASAAFPPALSPLRLDLRPFKFVMQPVDDREPEPAHPSLLRRAVLTDGGVYDNHGLQPLIERCRMLLVSDGGAPWSTSTRGFYRWLPQLKRVLDTTDNQVRALRRQDLIGRFIAAADPTLDQLPADSKLRRYLSLRGTYWAISTDPARYPADRGDLAQDRWRRLSSIGTWLHFLGARETEDLVNWGYLVSDLALRSFIDPKIPAVTSLPIPAGTVNAGWQAKAAKWLGDHLPLG
ncbi:patatin-like phospholipase family protein [Bradyrhizobium sp. PMVTL-01]|uniref:patatin-like phospholipase family protein n=1 Tax=Bradyrhizobium sp. PMVTL-01 TaxID=3434999 RepID=UPI003F71C2E5